MPDLNTIRLVAMISFTCFTLAIVMLWRLVPQERSLKDWVLATMLIAVSLLLLGLRGVIPNFISITIANTFLILGIGYIYVGTCNLLGGSKSDLRWLLFATIATFLIGFSENISFRVSAYALLDVPFLAFCAWLFWRAKGNRQIVVMQRITAIIFAIGALMFMVRAFKPPPTSAPSINIIAPNWLEVIPYVYAIMFSMWLSITLLLIVSFRLQSQKDDLMVSLSEEKERLRLALISADQGWFDLNVGTGQVLVSPEYPAMLGYDPATFHSNLQEWLANIHPEDIVAVREAMQKCLRDGGPESMDYRRRTSSGDWLWINSIGSITEWDQSHRPLRMIGIHTNITERKQAENELKIAATAFESQEGIIVTDANSIILRVNHAFTATTGYTSEEAVGQTPRLLSSGRQDKAFYEVMWEHLNQTGAWEGEIWNRRKSGDIYPEHLMITAVKDASGIVTNYVATLTDITMSKAASDEIKSLAFYDPLTRLPNRRLLLDRLQQALASSTRSGQRGALLFLDLDHFKTLNDSLGHDIGDLLLQQVASRLRNCVREGDTVARLGGDEFVVLLEDLSEQSIDAATQTEVIAQKILTALNQPYQLGTHEYHSTPSVGATLFNDHDAELEIILKQADIAMYQSKTEGRNTLRFYDPKMQEAITTRVDMERELRKATAQQQFQLYYQIQVDNTGRPFGAEALIRWLHPERNMIPPFQFIPLAEETGLILPIGQWVLETACAQLKIWHQNAHYRDFVLSVNVSAKQFHQANFVTQVQETMQRHGIDPTKLKLELTESMLVKNIDDIIEKMNALSQIGVRFSLDDFGTGYSSLQYLKKLPLSQLKIDQSFVRDIATDDSDRAIVRTIITMASSLDISVIAEGVESEEQRQYLLDNGCANFQGYLFGKPVPIDEFESLLLKS
ncbi:MAG: EAL domain-containing protein [Methylotenera sp.]|nr:EAL domain-containing protein [Methylotenera sp.]MDP1959799.1 EAL domain-containing protein [Methylotenera sp.]MDP3207154.1 EAL domain-containing protein [Methylotenera sp.]MDP3942635.1 EAL domain-containing protein [Methylotenera sp.]